MIRLAEKHNCTGCAACQAACAHGAIRMVPDQEGFVYPQIDEKRCVECGACARVCPAQRESLPAEPPRQVWAAVSRDEDIRRKSSSGGVFTALARRILEDGGIVYGAALMPDNTVQHLRVQTEQELAPLRGSKYVQSDMKGCLASLCSDLRAGRRVLFTGTPCQIAGAFQLAREQGIDDSRLVLCDIVCHGVPSPLVWKEYVSLLEAETGGGITDVTFRGKEEGWHAPIAVRFRDEQDGAHTDRRFTQLFLRDLILRPACHHCRYTTPNRVSDLTIADFWGIENTANSELDDNGGTSLVMVRSEKGRALLEKCEELHVKESSEEQAVANQATLRAPYPCPAGREQFWNEFLGRGISDVLAAYTSDSEPNVYRAAVRFGRDDVAVIVPDGPGSKGDEALLRGFLNAIHAENIVVLNPRMQRWRIAVPDRAAEFREYYVPHEEMAQVTARANTLLIVGTDTIDGTCGAESSLPRLRAAQSAADAGARVCVFCSFRSDVKEEVLEAVRALPNTVEFYLRDTRSVENFRAQTGREGKFFPDFGFFCESRQTLLTKKLIGHVRQSKGSPRVGVNFGEPTFRSFYAEHTMENRAHYVESVMETILEQLPQAHLFLIGHDFRHWEGYFSDIDYQNLAYETACRRGWQDRVERFPARISHAELLEVLPELDLLVTGRMHMSVAAMHSGILPIVYTGAPKDGKFSMIDKVRGMLATRIGREDLVAVNRTALKKALCTANEEKNTLRAQMLDAAKRAEQEDLDAARKLRDELALPARQDLMREDLLEESLMQISDVVRQDEEFAGYARRVSDRRWQQLLDNKQGHIEMLLQSERDLKAALEEQKAALLRQKKELARKADALDEKVLEIIRLEEQAGRIPGMENEINILRGRSNVLDQVYASRTWRYTHRMATIFRKFFPAGSRRGRAMVAILRAPIRFEHWLRAIPRARRERAAAEAARRAAEEARANWFERLQPLCFIERERPQVSIIIPVYNQVEYTYNCLRSIQETCRGLSYEVILADDNSTDDTKRLNEKVEGLRIVRNPENLRFLRNCNNAAQQARGEFIVFLNNDTVVHEDWLQTLLETMEEHEDCGIAGSKLVYANGTLQEAGGILWSNANAWNYGNGQDPENSEFNYLKEADYISGCSLMIRASLWNEIGGFDERFAPAYCEDSDLCFEVRARGFKVLYQPASVVTHFEGVSNGTNVSSGQKRYQVINREKFYEKWKKELESQCPDAQDVFLARDRSKDKPCLLFVDHYVPTFDQDAGSRTVFEYLRLFASHGYNVKFIPDNFYRMPEYTEVLQQMGIEVLYGPWYAQHWQEWVRQNAKYIRFAFLNRPHISVKYIDVLRRDTKARIIYYGHDLHFLREQRQYEITGDSKLLESSERWRAIELSMMRKADMAYYPSKIEEDFIHSIDPEIRVKAIPAYIYSNVVTPDYELGKRSDLMFIGGFNHTPNVDAVEWFAQEIWPKVRELCPGIRMHILGSHPPKTIEALDAPDFRVHGFVSDEVLATFYSECRISVVPLRYGAGIKGKVIEAMKSGIPVMTTSVGAEGIVGAEDILAVEDDADAFAERIAALYNNGEKLAAMSRAGCEYVRTHYGPENALRTIQEDFT